MLECHLYNPVRDNFPLSFKNVVSPCINNQHQPQHQSSLMCIKYVIPINHWHSVDMSGERENESLHTQVVIWVNVVLNHTNSRTMLPKYEDSCMVCRLERYCKQKYCQTPIH